MAYRPRHRPASKLRMLCPCKVGDHQLARSHPYARLAGVDSVIEDCKMFCVVSYMAHVNRARVQGGVCLLSCSAYRVLMALVVPGLLVTGRSGAGKTSILRTAAKALQEDPRALACKLATLLF